MTHALKYQNQSAQLVYSLNALGLKHYGQEHRLGSQEMDMISEFVGRLVDGAVSNALKKAAGQLSE